MYVCIIPAVGGFKQAMCLKHMYPGSQADHQPELLMINHVTKTMVNGHLLKTNSPMVFAMDFGPPRVYASQIGAFHPSVRETHIPTHFKGRDLDDFFLC